ncbi:MAG: hypothetical protein J6P72_09615 [Firmicutes bacterium]|nr:hypothetical protein [Bacillota bacterium]
MSEVNWNVSKEPTQAQKDQMRIDQLNAQLNKAFAEAKKQNLKDAKDKKKGKKKSGKEALVEDAAKKKEIEKKAQELKEKEKAKEDKEAEKTDPNTVRGRMNLLYLQQHQRRKDLMMLRMEMKILDDVTDIVEDSGKAMAEYVMLSAAAMGADGRFNPKKLNAKIPEGIFDENNPEHMKLLNWLLVQQSMDQFMDHMDDMENMTPEAFYKQMASEYADHLKAEKLAEDPDAIPVAPKGFHAPDMDFGPAPVAGDPSLEPEELVLKPHPEWENE